MGEIFDVYVEYKHVDVTEGIVGIEVKNAEEEYLLKAGSTEAEAKGNQKVFQHTPLDITSFPPSSVTFPPEVAVV